MFNIRGNHTFLILIFNPDPITCILILRLTYIRRIVNQQCK